MQILQQPKFRFRGQLVFRRRSLALAGTATALLIELGFFRWLHRQIVDHRRQLFDDARLLCLRGDPRIRFGQIIFYFHHGPDDVAVGPLINDADPGQILADFFRAIRKRTLLAGEFAQFNLLGMFHRAIGLFGGIDLDRPGVHLHLLIANLDVRLANLFLVLLIEFGLGLLLLLLKFGECRLKRRQRFGLMRVIRFDQFFIAQ